MNSREKMLMYGVAAVAGLYLLYLGFGRFSSGLERRRDEIAKAEQKANELNLKLVTARVAINKLNQWRDQSLPSRDPKNPMDAEGRQAASHVYTAWLQKTFTESRINPQSIAPATRTSAVTPPIATVGFTVKVASTQLTNVIDFLYKFYNAGMLHQITRMDLQKDPASQNLKMDLNIEAMILPGATTEKLPETKVNAFQLASVDAYKTLITGRNIFVPFTMPRNPAVAADPPPQDGEVDNSRFALFSGTSGETAWVYVQSTGDQKFLKVNDTLTVDKWSTKIVGVEPRFLVVEDSATQRQTRVPIGELIRDTQEGRRGRGGAGGGRGGRGGGGRGGRGGRGGDAAAADGTTTGATARGGRGTQPGGDANAAAAATAAGGESAFTGRGGRGGGGGRGGRGGRGGGGGAGGFGGGAPAEAAPANETAPANQGGAPAAQPADSASAADGAPDESEAVL